MEELLNTVSEKTGLSMEEIKAKIKAKQGELSGLVSEEGAAYIVANELGVKTRNRVIEHNLKVKDIMPEMRSVTVVGRITNIIGPREFTTKKGIKSKVANLDIIDDSGSIRIVLWNMSDNEKIEKGLIKVGDIIQVRNGYVREGFRGGLEVNLGNRGILVTEPEDVNEDDFPEAEEIKMVSIKDVKVETPVSLVGRVTHSFGVNEFQTSGRKGKVGNLIVNDGTGSAKLVLWNEQADLVDSVKIGDVLKVDNGYAKEGLRGMEVQANWATKIEKNPSGVEVPSLADLSVGFQKQGTERKKIADLKEGDVYKEIRGVLVNFYGDKLVYDMCPNCNKKVENSSCPKCGEVKPNKLLIVTAIVDDGTGTIRSVFFRDVAEKLVGMSTDEIARNSDVANKKLSEMLGTEKVIEGKVRMNEVMGGLEFSAFKVGEVNPSTEAEKIITKIKT